MTRRSTTTAALTSAALVTTLLALVSPPASAGALRYVPAAYKTSATGPNSLTGANRHVFVADANSVLVYDESGSYHSTIAGVFGAMAVTADPGGTKVYVAESTAGKIAVIDTATLLVTDEVAVTNCTISALAVVGSTLYFGYACTTNGPGAINHVDLTSLTANDPDTPDVTGLSSTPSLTTDDGRLIALDSSGTLRSWAGGGDGALNDLKTGDAGFTGSSEARPIAAGHGRLITRSDSGVGYSFAMYDAGTLALVTTLPTAAYPEAVGVAPDGTLVGTTMFGGSDPSTSNSFWFFDPDTAALKRTSAQPGDWGEFNELNAGVAFNAAGTIAYTLAKTSNQVYYLLASSVPAPTGRTVSVKVTSPKKYGSATKFTITGTPHTTAKLTIHNTGTGGNSVVSVNLGSSGVAVVARVSAYSGTVKATIAGDLTHSGYVSGTATYRVPSQMAVAMSKPTKVRSGIYYYSKPSKARQVVSIKAKATGRLVTAKLYRKKIGTTKWVHVQTAKLHSDSSGRVGTYMKAMAKGCYYKITYSFKGDTFNGASSASTKAFRLT